MTRISREGFYLANEKTKEEIYMIKYEEELYDEDGDVSRKNMEQVKYCHQVSWNSTDPSAIHMWFRNENTLIYLL